MARIAGLYWEEHGPRDAPPLLLSAGLGGSGNYWQPNLAALAERHRVILYDHRGTGRSDRALPGHVTVASMAQDVRDLLDGLGIAQAGIVGHAAGGVIGLQLALDAPDRVSRLVVVNGWARLDPHFARCFDVRLTLLRDSGPRAYLHAQPIFLYPAGWISDHHARLAAEEEAHLADFPGAETVGKRVAALRSFNIAGELGRIAVPVLAVAASDDMLVPAKCSQALVDGLPHGQLGRMGWGGHACNVTDPQSFNRLVLAWLGAGPGQ